MGEAFSERMGFEKNRDAAFDMATAMEQFGNAAESAGQQLLAANIGVLMEQAIGPSIEYVKASAEETADAMGLVGKERSKFLAAEKKKAEAEKAMQLSTGEQMKAATRDVLKTIATQAAVEAAFNFAKGLAALALGPFGGASAGQYFAAAAAMTAVAAAAGLAAKAIGPVRKQAPPGAAREERAERRPEERDRGDTGPGTQHYTTIINVLPGTDAERIGAATLNAINKHQRSRGRRELGDEDAAEA